jgi:hypothetical protein
MASADPTWGIWVAQVYQRVPFFVPENIVARLGDLLARFPTEMHKPLQQLAAYVRLLSASSPEESRALASLERLLASVTDREETRVGAAPTDSDPPAG